MLEQTVRPKKLRLSKETLRRLDQGTALLSLRPTTSDDSIDSHCFMCPTTDP